MKRPLQLVWSKVTRDQVKTREPAIKHKKSKGERNAKKTGLRQVQMICRACLNLNALGSLMAAKRVRVFNIRRQ